MMKKEEVKKNTQTMENESGRLHGQSFPDTSINMSSSGLLRKTKSVRWTVSSRKAMNLDTIETGASGDDCGLGGIGESRGNKALSVTGFRLGGRNDRGNKDSESGCSSSPSSSGLTRGSRNKDSESGRSMVETLGVLAIMGVLAIGGIAGYRYAMDKYNANEILNEVRKRAVTASQQRILGRTIDLSEWSNTIQGHPVTAADNYGGDTSFFALTVSGIEKGVCDQVIKEKIPFAVNTWVGESSEECIEGNNDITFAFANTLDGEPAPGCENVTCQAGTICSDGFCLCPTGQEVCGTICCPAEQMCSSDVGGCVDVTGCKSNADCGDDEYCEIRAGKDDSEASCYKSYTGTCVSKGDLPAGVAIEGLGTVYKSSGIMTWWSAKNWFRAHGKRLISADALGCYSNTDGTTPHSSLGTGTARGYCCAEGQASCGSDKSKQSEIMQALWSQWGNRWVWTDTSYDSCGVFGVSLDNGYVGYFGHRYGSRGNALCE